jgi:hypothetical protein
MNNETKSKMDELFAAMNQQKPQVKAATKQEQPRTFESLPEIETAAKSGEVISLSNLADLVNKEKEQEKQIDTTGGKIYCLESIQIIWHEGTGEFDGKIFKTWSSAEGAFYKIASNHGDCEGYTKVKICVKWEGGHEITDRTDVSKNGGDFWPFRESLGTYLQKQNSVMYGSNLKTRENLSFTDAPQIEDEREIEQINISGLFSESVPAVVEQPKQEEKVVLTVVDYSPKAFAIVGDTKAFKLRLRDLGGRFNPFLTCGAGWIFPKTKQTQVLASLGI